MAAKTGFLGIVEFFLGITKKFSVGIWFVGWPKSVFIRLLMSNKMPNQQPCMINNCILEIFGNFSNLSNPVIMVKYLLLKFVKV